MVFRNDSYIGQMRLTIDAIRTRFRACGVRLTPQRAAIYRELAGTTSHPTADDLFRAVRRRYPMISRNTVYYTLGVLRKAGLAHEVNVGHDSARFDANVSLHHHLVCLGCGHILDLMDDALDRVTVARGLESGFQVLGHRVEFHGYCRACRGIGRGPHEKKVAM